MQHLMAFFATELKTRIILDFRAIYIRCQKMATFVAIRLKQCLFSRTTRWVILSALFLSLIVTYVTGIWNVEVQYDLQGRKVSFGGRLFRYTSPPTPTSTQSKVINQDVNINNQANQSDYEWDENKLRAGDTAGNKDNNASFTYLDKIIDKIAPTKQVPHAVTKDLNNKTDNKTSNKTVSNGTTTLPKAGDEDSNLQKIVPMIPSFRSENANCAKIIAEDKMEMKSAGKYQRKNNKITIPDYHYITATKDCAKFKLQREYIDEPLSAEEAEFPIAFSMLIYKDVEQFERLLRVIYRPQNYYCIHVDIKSKADVKKAAKGIASCFDNIFISSQSFDVEWGSYTVLQPELNCMEDLWQYKKWKYFINLTGQEFPLQTIWDMVKILKVYNGANNMEGTVERFVFIPSYVPM